MEVTEDQSLPLGAYDSVMEILRSHDDDDRS